MNALFRPPLPEPPPRLLTVADLAALPTELATGPVRYELDNGSLIINRPPGDLHGAVEGNLTGELREQGQKRGLGKVRCGEVAVVLWRNPDRVVGADVVYIANRSLPLRLSPEGYLETIPDLAVEVRSKNDTKAALERKVADYLAAGVHVVWVADPGSRTVTAYGAASAPVVHGEADILTLEDILPGFRMPVTEVFQI
jgi:Uma2 family endonuclease